MPDSRCITPSVLTHFAVELFKSAKDPADEARIVAESLVDANLRGHNSHGVIRVPDYVGQFAKGELVAGAVLETLSETESALTADAHFGFGQVQAVKLIERLVPKAKQQGIACGTMLNCGHVGRLSEWTERIAAGGLTGLMTVNDNGVLQCVAPLAGHPPAFERQLGVLGVVFKVANQEEGGECRFFGTVEQFVPVKILHFRLPSGRVPLWLIRFSRDLPFSFPRGNVC